jgi:hypothetical protein
MMKKLIFFVILAILISVSSATMQTCYPNAIARYTAFGISIPTEEQFNARLLGQEHPSDPFNPAISFQTRIIVPGTPVLTQGALKFNLWKVMGILSATRTYQNKVPIYSVQLQSWNGYGLQRFYKTTRDLNEAYLMYSSQLVPNLYSWENILINK